MPRSIKLYLWDILHAIKNIQKSTQDLNYLNFLQNSLVQRAVCWDLLTIGEAIKNIPLEIRNQHPFHHWKEVAGLRDVLAHSYFSTDMDLIWDIITTELEELKQWIETISHLIS